MKTLQIMSSAAIAALILAGPIASVAAPSDQSQRVEIVKRGPDGHAVIVRVDGKEYAVCSQEIQDSCINAYQAGLKWGHEPLANWPGQPASERHEEGLGG